MGRILARSRADDIVSRSTRLLRLDRHAIAGEMLNLLPGDAGLFEQVFDAISSNARDDVAVEIVAQLRGLADPKARVTEMARGGGRHALLRVVRELQAGYTTDDEARDMQDLLRWLEPSAPTIDRWNQPTLEVEVITFERGNAFMDWVGENVAGPVSPHGGFGAGARGHTAIIVGGLAYSFDEGGWEVGETKAEYLAESQNLVRDGVGQVLDLGMRDAHLIQAALDHAANTGVYYFGGDVCSDATARALNVVLGNLRRDSNPKHLRAQIAAIPLLVYEERHYRDGVLVPTVPVAPSPAQPSDVPDNPNRGNLAAGLPA